MYSKKNSESSDLGKEGETLLQTDGVLELHQSSIADLPRVQFIDDDAEVPVSGTPEPEPEVRDSWERALCIQITKVVV